MGSIESHDLTVGVLAPLLGVGAESSEGEQLREILGAAGLTLAQFSLATPTVPATSAAAAMIPDRTAGIEFKMKRIAAHFADRGWTAHSGPHGVSYSPPPGATDEDIAQARSAAAAIMDQ